MRRFIAFIPIIALGFAGCADKIQGARIASAAYKVAIEIAQSGFDSADNIQKNLCTEVVCLKLDPNKGAAYKQCLTENQSAKLEWQTCWNSSDAKKSSAFFAKMKPQLVQAAKTMDAVIEAAAQAKEGQTVDYITPIKQGACLLSKVVVWLPDAWKAKIQTFLDLMVGFACDSNTANMTPEKAILITKKMKKLLAEVNALYAS